MRLVITSGIIAVAVVTIALISLDFILDNAIKARQKGDSACPHDKELRTYQDWTRTVTFPYTAPDEKLRRVKENYSHVDVGSSKQAVIEAFGPPDFEQEVIPIEPWRPCAGYEFVYYFSMLAAGNDNEFKDKRIEVFFNVDGRAHWIAGNIGLPEKGGYAVRP